MYIALNQTTRALGRSLINDHMKKKVGKAFEAHFYANMYRYISDLEQAGHRNYARELRGRIVRYTEEIEDTGMREAIRLFRMNRFTAVLPESKSDG